MLHELYHNGLYFITGLNLPFLPQRYCTVVPKFRHEGGIKFQSELSKIDRVFFQLILLVFLSKTSK